MYHTSLLSISSYWSASSRGQGFLSVILCCNLTTRMYVQKISVCCNEWTQFIITLVPMWQILCEVPGNPLLQASWCFEVGSFISRRRQWHPTPVLLPGKSHGWRSLVGCRPWGRYSRTRLSDFTFTFHFHALEKEMATHSSVLAWRISGMAEPGGLPSMGSHRVGHDWSDLAAVGY